MTDLKRCPFCNGEAHYDEELNWPDFKIFCSRCLASTDNCRTKDEAINDWNSRYFPEGCTPEDAMKLREANHALAAEKEVFQSLLTTAMTLIKEQGLEDEFFIRRGKSTT